MQNSLYRITAYAYISMLETCLKNILLAYLATKNINDLSLPQQAKDKAIDRLYFELGFSIDELFITDIIDYFDFGDLLQIINMNKSIINKETMTVITKHYSELERIIPIRNAVMHSRPINFSDYHYIFDFCSILIEEDKNNLIWSELILLKIEIDKNPNYVFLNYKIPDLKNIVTNHYLPFPDYDETGLIGRELQEEHLKGLCYRPNISVISVIGEGGIGKTALALKVAYDLMDDPDSPFDTVIWVSSKTTKISLIEITEIKGAINSSLGMLSKISEELSGIETNNIESALKEITEYLEQFKIALFIDNLETILDENINRLVESIGVGSKIIFTSRIGLGAYEYPIKLKGIDEANASRFLRSLTKIRGIDQLKTLPEVTLKNYVNRMNCNPSYIKWFVSCVQAGKTPEEILQNSSKFLEFCMSNVYEYLNPETKHLTQVMLCANGARELPELQNFSDYEALKLQECINELLTTNMLEQHTKPIMGTTKSNYELSELARKFLSLKYPPSKNLRDSIRKKLNKIQSNSDDYTQKSSNPYNNYTIKIRDKKDVVVAEQLNIAAQYIRQDKFEKAQYILDQLKALSPDYYEIHRIYAFFYQKQENIQEAINCHELAISLAPTLPVVYYWYGRFLLDQGDSENALKNIEIALKFDKKSPDIILTLIRANLYQKNFIKVNELFEQIQLDLLDDPLKKIYYIQRIQYFYRLADNAATNSNFSESLQQLQNMKNIYESIQIKHRHSSLVTSIRKSLMFLKRIHQSSTNTQTKTEASELINWINIQT
ncbi:hypothetical protein J7624_02540 [Wohlfahrtiimonas chitiniclastica]|uniref:NB-ARC domain-containing protein n=1 Tax=Wohlfahrtiimonas chitiniclastica TaxID=400946 RepID=UPI001BD05745|nr:NB-ARC domain-containing protein [Wohlfahrtiimonas chitiniclastica]MBS7826029.1 hypothetical protein [Wohlfahrtiimonas chitiniclastica]